MTIGWGGVSRIDLEPAGCSDPECDADHGYTGVFASDDFSLRVSAAARVDPVVDPRSDWFVRRMPTPIGDTIPG